MPMPIRKKAQDNFFSGRFIHVMPERYFKCLPTSEEPIGIYSPRPERKEEDILITVLGFHLKYQSENRFIAYEKISETISPPINLSDENICPFASLILDSGEEVRITISENIELLRSWNMKYYPMVFEFLGFTRQAIRIREIELRKLRESQA